MKFHSTNWNLEFGCCVKHGIPEIPCPQCIATKDKDLEIILSDVEKFGTVKVIIPPGFENHIIK